MKRSVRQNFPAVPNQRQLHELLELLNLHQELMLQTFSNLKLRAKRSLSPESRVLTA